MKDNETLNEFEARLKREYDERQAVERREQVRSSHGDEYATLKAGMLSNVRATLTRKPATEYPDVRGMSDAEYQAQRSRLVRGGR
ncbi:hypothetical protein DIE14_23145 [Burkholderia sp. Bp9017]|uniref:hypothetical protein n=1 Tax=unclassified Burkholderia TaxID=2613784 RepID=UPI000F5E567B|nr:MULTISPECIES: hypothetical protein [unclassified Burkholderia]RQZ24055.1 hypothetical protein DIE14_23145 [Burkholderia sp. Bp9017]RQZ31995.1 hypothetical protein DIE13_23015 [Burkholderia sp. Bp9016]